MIDISIDDRSCTSCTLCTEVCPTEVLEMKADESAPEVVNAAECFACLSCSEICPAGAIDHQGIDHSDAFYRNPYGAKMASRLGFDVNGGLGMPETEEQWTAAVDDLGVRLRSMAEVLHRTLGSSLPAVGSMAGKTLSRHLPRYQQPDSLVEVLKLAKQRFSPAWEMTPHLENDGLVIDIDTCFVREVCHRDGTELGSHLCILFCHYLAGYVGALSGARLRFSNADRGDHCTYRLKVYA